MNKLKHLLSEIWKKICGFFRPVESHRHCPDFDVLMNVNGLRRKCIPTLGCTCASPQKEEKVNKGELQSLKKAFYEWLGKLSIEEIMSNYLLIERAKHFERTLLALG